MSVVYLPDDILIARLHRLAQEYGLELRWDSAARAFYAAPRPGLADRMAAARDNLAAGTATLAVPCEYELDPEDD